MNKFPRISLEKTGLNIIKLMDDNNITVKQLQEIMGFENPQAIYKWRRGECLPTIDNLIILANIFNVKVDSLLVLDD